jgi:hypothetical protein
MTYPRPFIQGTNICATCYLLGLPLSAAVMITCLCNVFSRLETAPAGVYPSRLLLRALNSLETEQ